MTEHYSSISQTRTTLEESILSEDFGAIRKVSIIEVLTQLARRKRLIAKVTGAAVLAGGILSFLLPVRYTAITTIMPPQQTPSSAALFMNQLSNSSTGVLSAAAGLGLGIRTGPNDIYLGLLKSRPIADAIIQKFNLAMVYRSRDMTAARKKLEDNTQITAQDSGFISVSVTDRDRNRSADLANYYTEQLRVLTQTLAVTEASQRRLFYESQLKEAKEALVAAEMNFQQIQQNKGMVQLDAQAKAMIEGLAALRAKAAAQEVEVQALRSYSTDRNPDVQMAERELSSVRTEIAQMEQNSHSSGFTDLGMKDVPGAALGYLTAQHEVLYRQTLFDLLIKQYDAAKLDEAKEAAVIQVVEPAIPPEHKSSPKRMLILLLTTIGGFFASCLLAMIQWWKELSDSEPEVSRQLQELKSALSLKRVAEK
jgi:tyrosine-protein kinase Etk/Wzc